MMVALVLVGVVVVVVALLVVLVEEVIEVLEGSFACNKGRIFPYRRSTYTRIHRGDARTVGWLVGWGSEKRKRKTLVRCVGFVKSNVYRIAQDDERGHTVWKRYAETERSITRVVFLTFLDTRFPM